MNRAITPPAYYAFSADFDYRKFLEERSHTDRIVMTIDDQSAAIIGGGDRLAEKMEYAGQVISEQIARSGQAIESGLGDIDQSLLKIDITLQDGFETVSADIRQLGSNIVEMRKAMEEGIAGLIASSSRTNEILSYISHLLETPDQVWSNEKFKAARTCSERGLWSEALEFVTKAIEGDEKHSGFKLEPSYYFLRGRILEGLIGTEIDFVDLDAAKRDFLLANRYYGPNDHIFKRMALTRAGWCCYCLGEFEEAELHLSAAATLAAVIPESDYLLAKVRARNKNFGSAKEPLAKAVCFESLYAYRAINDDDFSSHLPVIRKWFSDQRDHLIRSVRAWRQNKIQPDQLMELAELHRSAGGQGTQVEEYLSELNCLDENMTLTEVVDFFYRDGAQGKAWEHRRAEIISHISKEIRSYIENLQGLRTKVVVPDVSVSPDNHRRMGIHYSSVVWGGVAGLVIALYFIAGDGGFQGGFGGLLTGVFGLIIFGIPGVMGGLVIGWLAGFPLSRIFDESRMERERAEQSKVRKLAQEKLFEEEKIVHARHSLAEDLKAKLEEILVKLGSQSGPT